MPKISVIVPVYMAEGYIAQCLDSILAQTFSDFEVIAVDDGSPDASYAVCQEYAAKDSRVILLRQENAGQAAARNHALSAAKGQWITYVDSDDVVHPQLLELLYHAVTASGAAVAGCQYVEGQEIPEGFFDPRNAEYDLLTMDEGTLTRLYDEERYPAWVACTKLVRRDLVERYPFREGRVFEDNEAVCRWVCRGAVLADLGQALYFYRKNPESTTKSSFSVKKLDYLWALESITKFYGEIGFSQMKARFASRYAQAAMDSCYGLREELGLAGLAKETGKRALAFRKEIGLPLDREGVGKMLDACDPGRAKLYWPISGIFRRVGKLFGKGA